MDVDDDPCQPGDCSAPLQATPRHGKELDPTGGPEGTNVRTGGSDATSQACHLDESEVEEETPSSTLRSVGDFLECLRSRGLEEVDHPSFQDGEYDLPEPLLGFLQCGEGLFPFQKQGLKWLIARAASHTNCILGDEMGLGKTVQSLAALCALHAWHDTPGPFLVVAPLSLLDGWAEMIGRFWPAAGVCRYWGDAATREILRDDVVQEILRQPPEKQNDPDLPFLILLTTNQILVSDVEFLSAFLWRCVVVDEAQSLKNSESVLHRTLGESIRDKHQPFFLLLTGTPVQNRLEELWALFNFLHPAEFQSRKAFMNLFASKSSQYALRHSDALHALTGLLVLRRRLAEVSRQGFNSPSKTEYVISVPLTRLQRVWYRWLLTRQKGLLESQMTASKMAVHNRRGLTNLLLQLRDCCNHPYLFDGAEPEPFEEGDHIWQVSGKMIVLDKLLKKLEAEGSRVLIFSGSTRVLDILQDYLSFRQYSHERLDGSVRGEDRAMIIRRFKKSSSSSGTASFKTSPTSSLERMSEKDETGDDGDPVLEDGGAFVFLLSLRAGGVGLNLECADCVVFFDSDWNPQMDLQAMARVVRPGQKKKVRVFRLLASQTVDEVIYRRAQAKLKLAASVLRGDDSGGSIVRKASTNFSSPAEDSHDQDGNEDLFDEKFGSPLETILFGLSSSSQPSDAALGEGDEGILGRDIDDILAASPTIEDSGGEVPSRNAESEGASARVGEATAKSATADRGVSATARADRMALSSSSASESNELAAGGDSIYLFDGCDYGKTVKALFKHHSDDVASLKALLRDGADRPPGLPKDSTDDPGIAKNRAVRLLTEDELEFLKTEAKERARQRKEELWRRNGYTSQSVVVDLEESNTLDEMDSAAILDPGLPHDRELVSGATSLCGHAAGRDLVQLEATFLHYRRGDASRPTEMLPGIVLLCADNSGKWCDGGLFAAVGRVSSAVERYYVKAKKMGDLHIGDVHLVPISNFLYVALCICQRNHETPGRWSKPAIDLKAMKMALTKAAQTARKMKASLHLPQIGCCRPPQVNQWYAVERLLKRVVLNLKIHSFIYHFPSKSHHQTARTSAGNQTGKLGEQTSAQKEWRSEPARGFRGTGEERAARPGLSHQGQERTVEKRPSSEWIGKSSGLPGDPVAHPKRFRASPWSGSAFPASAENMKKEFRGKGPANPSNNVHGSSLSSSNAAYAVQSGNSAAQGWAALRKLSAPNNRKTHFSAQVKLPAAARAVDAGQSDGLREIGSMREASMSTTRSSKNAEPVSSSGLKEQIEHRACTGTNRLGGSVVTLKQWDDSKPANNGSCQTGSAAIDKTMPYQAAASKRGDSEKNDFRRKSALMSIGVGSNDGATELESRLPVLRTLQVKQKRLSGVRFWLDPSVPPALQKVYKHQICELGGEVEVCPRNPAEIWGGSSGNGLQLFAPNFIIVGLGFLLDREPFCTNKESVLSIMEAVSVSIRESRHLAYLQRMFHWEVELPWKTTFNSKEESLGGNRRGAELDVSTKPRKAVKVEFTDYLEFLLAEKVLVNPEDWREYLLYLNSREYARRPSDQKPFNVMPLPPSVIAWSIFTRASRQCRLIGKSASSSKPLKGAAVSSSIRPAPSKLFYTDPRALLERREDEL